MDILLTDDEIAALTSSTDTAWPVPLLSVRADSPNAVAAAVFRGMRSLAVRGLGEPSHGEPLGVSAELRELMAIVESPRASVVAHVSDSGKLGYGGSALLAFAHSEGVLLDSVTAMGIHAFRTVDAASAARLVLDFARSLKAPAEESSPSTVVVIARSDAQEVLIADAVGLAKGRVDGGPGQAQLSRGPQISADVASDAILEFVMAALSEAPARSDLAATNVARDGD